MSPHPPPPGRDWPRDIYEALRAAGVAEIAYVPDAGHARLIDLLRADAGVGTVALTTEEEGVALAAGAWLGGRRAALLMQSSGVGNCVNMLSLAAACRFPLLTIVTMRGEWAEFNPWQTPMGRASEAALRLMGVDCLRVDTPEEAGDVVAAAARLAFESDQQIAVILSQRMIGAKKWTSER